MKRQDIKVGVEYARTGPLAYGREPNVAPAKVRFLDPEAGSEMAFVVTAKRTGRHWHTISYEFTSYQKAVAQGVTEFKLHDVTGAEGELIHYLSVKPVGTAGKSPLAAERWLDDHWIPVWVSPAEVHRTWAEVETEQDAAAEALRQKQIEAGFPEVEALLERLQLTHILKPAFRGKAVTLAVPSVDELPEALRMWAMNMGLLSD